MEGRRANMSVNGIVARDRPADSNAEDRVVRANVHSGLGRSGGGTGWKVRSAYSHFGVCAAVGNRGREAQLAVFLVWRLWALFPIALLHCGKIVFRA